HRVAVHPQPLGEAAAPRQRIPRLDATPAHVLDDAARELEEDRQLAGGIEREGELPGPHAAGLARFRQSRGFEQTAHWSINIFKTWLFALRGAPPPFPPAPGKPPASISPRPSPCSSAPRWSTSPPSATTARPSCGPCTG